MPDDPLEQSGRTVGRGGLALMLPMAMAVSPIAGYFIFQWIGTKVGWEDLKYVGLVLGIIGGVRESLHIFKILSAPPPKAKAKPPAAQDKPEE